MFRRKKAAPATQRGPEVIEITLHDVQALERVFRYAAERKRICRPDITQHSGNQQDRIIATLYQRAGAASAVEPDPDRVRIPLDVHTFSRMGYSSLDFAIWSIENYRGSTAMLQEARQLMNRFNALLGRARAVRHLGGVAVFDTAPPARPALPEGVPGTAESA